MAPSVARESTLHCKLDSQLKRAAVRSTFWVGGKWIMEILDEQSDVQAVRAYRSEMGASPKAYRSWWWPVLAAQQWSRPFKGSIR
jgi:hypothetical protein